MMIESLVAVLLLLTIGYCVVLNRRLKKLKADEQALRDMIAELITATEIAERAIAGLKVTVQDCDQTLGERLRAAERMPPISSIRSRPAKYYSAGVSAQWRGRARRIAGAVYTAAADTKTMVAAAQRICRTRRVCGSAGCAA